MPLFFIERSQRYEDRVLPLLAGRGGRLEARGFRSGADYRADLSDPERIRSRGLLGEVAP